MQTAEQTIAHAINIPSISRCQSPIEESIRDRINPAKIAGPYNPADLYRFENKLRIAGKTIRATMLAIPERINPN